MQQRSKIFIGIASVLLALSAVLVHADTSSDIQTQIDAKNQQIEALQAEIAKYEQSLDQTSSQAKTLQNDLTTLTTAKKKLQTQLKLTEASLEKTADTITEVTGQISDTKNSIDKQKAYLGATLRDIEEEDDISLLQVVLEDKSLSQASDYIVNSEKIAASLQGSIAALGTSESTLAVQKTDAQSKQTELAKLKTDLSGQTEALSETADQKTKLLADTKGQEATYQSILDQKKANELQFEQDLFSYESSLGIKVNPAGYPSPEHGILSWPLDTAITVTQMFGKTSSSGRLYASGTHNGTDFHASDGTPVHAALGGTVRATGNTDLKKNCLSYGKWVLIDHPDGLSTLYAHFSAFNVKAGDTVNTGDIIGWSGRTGYVTGPHLHLTLLVSASTDVMVYPPAKAINCGGVTIPIAPPDAFLDPMAYLPVYTGTGAN